MSFCFEPKHLIEAGKEIKKTHQKSKKPSEINRNGYTSKLIQDLVCMDLKYVKRYAYCLSREELREIAAYIPFNYLNVKNMVNVYTVFSERSSEEMCDVLYEFWQDNFFNNDCNRFIQTELKEDDNWKTVLKKNKISTIELNEILDSENVPYCFGKKIVENTASKEASFEERFSECGIRKNSRLYQECEFYFYTYCDEKDYLRVDKFDLVKIIREYEKKSKELERLFLQNFLSTLDWKTLQSFWLIADWAQQSVGDSREKIQAFFGDVDSSLIQKYMDWVNGYKVQKYFGKDERSNFWRRCRFESIQKYEKSNSIAIKFEGYYVIEFLGKSMGPAYIYPAEYFESTLKWWLIGRNNSESRKLLYHNEHWSERVEHMGNWEIKMRDLLRGYRMTSWVEL